MNALLIGIYGIYFVLVGLSGNAPALVQATKQQAGGFLPWAIGIAVLSVAYEYPGTRKMAQPFIILLILSFILSNFDNLKAEFQKLEKLAGQ